MKKISFFILAAMLATACQKENTSPNAPAGTTHLTGLSSQLSASSQHPADSTAQLDGTYAGYFSLTTSGKTAKVGVQFKIVGNQFHDIGGNNDYAVGDGTISSVDATLTFTNADVFPTVILPGQQIPFECVGLTDTYDFAVKTDSLLLTKTLQGATYSYALKKQ
jgi:hypothetical protein